MTVHQLRLGNVAPLASGDVESHPLLKHDVARAHRHQYLLLDPCRIFALSERLEGRAACLLRDQGEDGIEDALPWLVQVDQNPRLLQDFLTEDPMHGLWSAEAGLLVCSDLEFEPLLRHLRKFHRCQITETGTFVMLRYWNRNCWCISSKWISGTFRAW